MDINFHEDLETAAARRPISKAKRWILFVFTPAVIILAATLGTVFESEQSIGRMIDVISSIALNILSFAWCRADSDERGYKLHRLFPFATIVFGIFALIYYLFRSRGLRGGFVSFGWLVLYAVICLIASLVIFMAILFVLVLLGIAKV